MAVSRMIGYRWECAGCASSQEAPVWRILDEGERPEVVVPGAPGLAVVRCLACEVPAWIEVPMLLIRPGNVPSLLLAVAGSELAEFASSLWLQLAHEAQAAGFQSEDVVGPVVPLPRALVPLVLERDVMADSADPEMARREVSVMGGPLPGWYATFLQNVRVGEPQRRAALALRQLSGVSSDNLANFLVAHPELGSDAAMTIVNHELAERTGEEDIVFLQARVRLVEGLAAQQPAGQVATEYLTALERFGQELNDRLSRLVTLVKDTPGAEGIPYVRNALKLGVALGMNDAEAELSAELALRLLSSLLPDSQATEEAVTLLQRALSLIPQEHEQRSAWVGNLAAAYRRRTVGDPAQNWGIMQHLLDSVCTEAERQADSRRWAMHQTNYGLLLSERPGGSGPEDLAHGIERIRAGLQERSPEIDVTDWAYSQLNLGLLLRRRAAGNDLRDAESCYRQALAHLEPAGQAQLWATLQNNLADVLLAADPPDAAGAVLAVNAGLKVAHPQTDPLTRARLLWGLGRAEDIRQGEHSAEAIAPRCEALSLLTPAQAPALYRRIGGELADAYGQRGDWPAAADIYAGMLSAFSMLYNAQASPAGRRSVIASSPTLARWAAYALARAGRPEQAIEAIENGRARQLSADLARETADLAQLSVADRTLTDRYQAALTTYRAALANSSHATAPANAQHQVNAAEKSIQQILEQIRAIPGLERFLQPMSVADICQAGGGDPVIYLVSAPAGSYVLVVRPGATSEPIVEAMAVPAITSVDVLRLEMFDYIGDAHAPGLLLAQSTDPLRRKTMLPAALERLIEMQPLIEPVADILTLSPGNRAVVIPTGLLGLIPLHATPLKGREGQVLDDLGEIYFAPSASAFAACRKRSSATRSTQLVGVADPQNSLSPLPGSRAELAAIRNLFEACASASCAFGAGATRSWLLQYIDRATHLHLACHGASTPGTTADSKLYLADDAGLTIDDLINGRLEGCRLAVASACQSGHYSTIDGSDEFTGLPSAFLLSGAACAIVSLWQVNDLATAILMVRFYELLLGAKSRSDTTGSPVKALRQARTWLRQLTVNQLNSFIKTHPPLTEAFAQEATRYDSPKPYSAPQYWAAFTAWGT